VQRAGSSGRAVAGAAWIFLSLAGVSAAITTVFLAMRAVMEIGGVCAEGGPYVPRQPCPDGVPLLMVGGIWGGMIFAFIYAWQVFKRGVPNFVWALWPALFLSLGWNFLEYGLDPPFGEGVAWGWLVCAVVFFVMGAGPLLGALPVFWRAATGQTPPLPPRQALRPPGTAAVARFRDARTSRAVGTSGSDLGPAEAGAAEPRGGQPDGGQPDGGQPDDVVSALERLHYLHRTGGLSDDEYEAAKARVLEAPS